MGHAITTKGQVTVPKPVRDHLGLVPGDRVEFEVQPDGRVTVSKAPAGEAGEAPGDLLDRVRRAAGGARIPDGMTVDEFMVFLRGEREDL